MSLNLKDKFDLAGKVALVTGASKGIGEAIAQGLAAYGAHVVVTSRKQEAVDAVATAINEAGYKATALACHMGDMEQIRDTVARTIEAQGGIDIIVNNAATNPIFGPLTNATEDAFDKIYQVNVKGPYVLAAAAQPSMAKRGGGSVINISSIGGISPEPMLGLYSVSKAALISLTKVMAKEWGGVNIRANAICPGLIKTKFSQALWSSDAILDQALSSVSLGRMGTVDEIAGLALFLASDAGSYCTGGVYTADGGHTA